MVLRNDSAIMKDDIAGMGNVITSLKLQLIQMQFECNLPLNRAGAK